MINIRGLKVLFKSRTYTVLTRKKTTSKKPEFFLFDLENKVFLSSLYWAGTDTYIFDDRLHKYQIEFYKEPESESVSYSISKID